MTGPSRGQFMHLESRVDQLERKLGGAVADVADAAKQIGAVLERMTKAEEALGGMRFPIRITESETIDLLARRAAVVTAAEREHGDNPRRCTVCGVELSGAVERGHPRRVHTIVRDISAAWRAHQAGDSVLPHLQWVCKRDQFGFVPGSAVVGGRELSDVGSEHERADVLHQDGELREESLDPVLGVGEPVGLVPESDAVGVHAEVVESLVQVSDELLDGDAPLVRSGLGHDDASSSSLVGTSKGMGAAASRSAAAPATVTPLGVIEFIEDVLGIALFDWQKAHVHRIFGDPEVEQ